jgi:hypothetical protein
MHSGERHSQLLPFFSTFAPSKVHLKILDTLLVRKFYFVYVDWRVGFSSYVKCYMD